MRGRDEGHESRFSRNTGNRLVSSAVYGAGLSRQ